MSYPLGNVVRLSVTYKDAAGVLINPSVATLKLTDPTGTETTPVLINDSTGLYHADNTVLTAGVWYYRFTGTGALVTGSPDYMFVVDYTKAP